MELPPLKDADVDSDEERLEFEVNEYIDTLQHHQLEEEPAGTGNGRHRQENAESGGRHLDATETATAYAARGMRVRA